MEKTEDLIQQNRVELQLLKQISFLERKKEVYDIVVTGLDSSLRSTIKMYGKKIKSINDDMLRLKNNYISLKTNFLTRNIK